MDYGEGKDISLPTCPRERLDREQVRYLSREERLDYLATVNPEGKLCWKRNGEPINTSVKWKDSVHGIVPVGDKTPGFTPASAEAARSSDSSDDESSDEGESSGAEARKDRYVNQDLKEHKGPKKLLHVSPATIFNQLLRTSVRKNTWIFVSPLSLEMAAQRYHPDGDREAVPISRFGMALIVSDLGRRHELQPLYWDQAIRILSTFLVPTRQPDFGRRAD